ncbi:MAG: nickel transporter [Actinomycetota bacterium]|nr:nickel transporter [Actinomycetota bacterium]
MRSRRALVLCALATALVLLPAGAATAHPLGNFSTNVYAGLRAQPGRLLIDYVVDMAEIPTFQARQGMDGDADGRLDAGEEAAFRQETCERLAAGIQVRVDGRRSLVKVASSTMTFPPGQADLPTLRLECSMVSPMGIQDEGQAGRRTVSYVDTNFAGRLGWREITATGDGARLVASDVPEESISRRLTAYPADLLQSPPRQQAASLTVQPGGPAAGGAEGMPQVSGVLGRRLDRGAQWMSSLMASRELTVPLALLALGLALVLGGLHGLAPGHGKTVMAAYIAGEQKAHRYALLIGLTVAATHTAGVVVLGMMLGLGGDLAPALWYPWLGMTSGLLIAGIGVGLLRRALGRRARPGHGPAGHHGPDGHHHQEEGLGWRGLVAMGFAGGLVPSPSALLVLLGAIALGRAWLGVALVAAYGIGMAVVLVGAGLLLLRARRLLHRSRANTGHMGSPMGPRLRLMGRAAGLARLLPVATAGLVMVGGLLLTARAAVGV